MATFTNLDGPSEGSPPSDLNLRKLDVLAEKWGRIVIPIYVWSQKRRNALDGIGSAFVVIWKKNWFFVTARHVVDHLVKTGDEGRLAVIADQSYVLRNIPFLVDHENDLAVCNLEYIIPKSEKKPTLTPIMLDRNLSDCVGTGIYLMQGYPSTQNQLESKYGKKDRKVHGYTLMESTSPKKLKTTYPSMIRYEFDINRMVNSSGRKIQPPSPHGVSGGPIYQVLMRAGQGLQLTLALSAVAVFWHRESKEVLGISTDALTQLLDRLLAASVI